MPDETNEFEERATLTQRRQMSGAAKLSRAKLEPIQTEGEDVKEGGSTGKIVIWVVAVITIAAAAYFGIKGYISKPADNTPTVTPTEAPQPTKTLAEKVVNQTILADSQATDVKADASFNTSNQTVGKASSTMYTINDVTAQKYQTFTRFTFSIGNPATEGADTEPFPVVNAAYDAAKNTITITFTQIEAGGNTSAFTSSEVISIGTPNVSKFSYLKQAPTDQEKYQITLNTKASYVLQAITASGNIIVDVKDPKPVATNTPAPTTAAGVTTTVAPTVVTTVPVVTITTTPVVSTGNKTEFGIGDQTITSSLTTNTFNMVDGYKYGDNWSSTATGQTYLNMFTFQKTLTSSTTIPNVSATLSGTTLTVSISNFVTANKAAATYSFPTRNVKSLEASVTNHVLKYAFTMNVAKEYRIVFDTDNKVLLIQVKN